MYGIANFENFSKIESVGIFKEIVLLSRCVKAKPLHIILTTQTLRRCIMRKIGLVVFWLASLYIISIVTLGSLVGIGSIEYLDALWILHPFFLLDVWFGVELGLEQVALTVVGVQLVGLVFLSVARIFERGALVKT